MSYLLQFLAGLLITNGIPHLVAGLQGMPFQSPFAKPSGVGESSPLVNVWWGFGNLVGGGALFVHVWPDSWIGWALAGAASLMIGSFCAQHFGKVRSARA